MKMKSLIHSISFVGLCLMISHSNLLAQVDIYKDSDPGSAIMEIQSNSKGVLLPKMTANQRNNISNPENGLLVYVTTTQSFWIYSGGSWVELASGGSGIPKQIRDGDANTVIHTSENGNEDKIRFKLGGTEHFVMDGPHLHVKNSGWNVFLGEDAGINTDLSSVKKNVFIGRRAGYSNQSGGRNNFIGFDAGYNTVTGFYNNFIGEDSGFTNVDGSYNNIIGSDAGKNITGDKNICIGDFSGPPPGSGNVNGRLYIDVRQSNNPLIYGEFENNIVQINGKLIAGTGNGNSGTKLLTLNSERPWVFAQSGSGSSTGLKLTLDSPTNKNKNFYIDNSGTAGVGIGSGINGSINEKLHVIGDAYKTSGGSGWATPSDWRLKKNIRDFYLGLEAILQLHPVRFQYNGKLGTNPDREEVGIIAQELQKVIPEMVKSFTTDEGEEYLQVNHSPLEFVLVNAVQELANENENLRTEIIKLTQLEERMAKLELAVRQSEVAKIK